jgi:hypothetical protein
MSKENTPAGAAAPEGGTGEKAPREFSPITTQEQLDHIVGARLARVEAKFADYGDLKAKAEKFDKQEEASKTELQKAEDRAAAAEKELQGYKAKEQRAAWAKEVSEATGVPAAALRGATKEEMQAHAETLKPLMATVSAPIVNNDGKAPTNLHGSTADQFEAATKGIL